MATVTIRVTEDESPVEGAEVVIGSVGEKSFTADVNGEIFKTVSDDYKIVAFITILLDGDHRHTSGSTLLMAGEAHIFDISHTG